MLSETELARLVQDFYASVLDRENELRIHDLVPIDEDARLGKAKYWAEIAANARADLGANNLQSSSFISAALIKKHGLSSKLDDIELRQVNQAMLRASCDLAEALSARFKGNFNFEPADKLLKLALSQPAQVQSEILGDSVPSAGASRSPRSSGEQGKLFSELADDFRSAQMQIGNWEKQTALQARKTYELFVEHCGDRRLIEYARSDAIEFRDMLIRLPANYGKAAEFRGLSPCEIVSAASETDVDKLSPRTVQRHLNALSALWEQAKEAGELTENVFKNLKLPKSKRAQDQRAMWTPENLKRLFDTPLWRGCWSQSRRTKAGNEIFRDEKFWLPLVALYSGMRQEEICQLHVEDIHQQDGIWVFDINSRPPRQVKNRNAIRIVPVHSELQKFGFIEFVLAQQSAGHSLVFHQLNPGGADLRFGHNYTKWFTRYRRDVGLYEKGLDFHSFRHSATTFMQWAEVPVSIIDALTGHATAGETARYTKNFQISQLKDGIEAIDIRTDISHLCFPAIGE